MRPTKLLNLLANNAKRGEFRAEGNTLYLYDVIVASEADAAWFGGVSAEAFVKQLAGMSGDVDLRINSPGGDVFAAVAIGQAIRQYKGNVTAHVDGLAASAASVIAVAADQTVMAPGSMMMIHKAWTIALGNSDEFTAAAALLLKIDGEIAASYARKSGKNEDFAKLMADETWMTAEEAIALGLANGMDESEKEAAAKNVAWDLSAFDRAPGASNGVSSSAEALTELLTVAFSANAKSGAGAPGPLVQAREAVEEAAAQSQRAERLLTDELNRRARQSAARPETAD